MALAASLCDARGVRFTALRRQILGMLWEANRALGAYELIEAIRRESFRAVGPPTVYRALEFLMAQGLVSKIESRNAYAPCAHPERTHHCHFFVCASCGASAELEDDRIGRLLAEGAASLGFRVTRPVVEVEGICPRCIETHGA